MLKSFFRHCAAGVTAGMLGLVPCVARSQQPTQVQVQQALQSQQVVAQLRSRLAASGLSNEQVRARLRAAGYSETLLDAYLPGGDATASTVPSDDAIAAISRLGLIDDAAQALQRPTTPATPEVRSNIFGIDVFRSSTSRFDPLTAGPVDANYKVGPRDVLALILTGGVEASHTLEVSGEGYVVIPQVGRVQVANLTLDQIRTLLYNRLGRVYSGLGRGTDAATQLTLSVARVRANQVFVIGEAAVPGSYQVSSAGTMLTALYAAGGPTINGGMRAVELRRAGRLLGTLDLYDYLVRGDASRDLRLESGDVLFVPFRGRRVTLAGEVGREAVYELKEGETLRDVVRYAGGLAPTASRHRIQIRRVLAPDARVDSGMERVVLDIPADQLAGGNVPAFPLEAADVVRVFGVSEIERNRVRISGHVWSPGELGFRPGMRLSEAIRAAGGTRPGVFTDQVLVTRTPADGVPVQLRARLVDSSGAVVDDLVLQENDAINVYSRADFVTERFIYLSGAVRSAGRVPYREGMTLRDAVLLAGGLTEGAYLREAELARVVATPQGGTSTQTLRVQLDSTYLFERGPEGRYLGVPGAPVPAASRHPDRGGAIPRRLRPDRPGREACGRYPARRWYHAIRLRCRRQPGTLGRLARPHQHRPAERFARPAVARQRRPLARRLGAPPALLSGREG
jgi:polysaccharide biosynthesis/export protein